MKLPRKFLPSQRALGYGVLTWAVGLALPLVFLALALICHAVTP